MDELIQPTGPLRAVIRPPGSKSITNRAVLCAAFAEGPSVLRGALDSEDTQVMIEALRKLGVAIDSADAGETLTIVGCGGQLPCTEADLFVANSGTTMRFLTALLTTCSGHFRLDGIPRMRQRPIGDLLDALRELGGDVRSVATNDCPPVVIEGRGMRGGKTTVRGNISSQYLSGLLMAAPYARHPVQLQVAGELVSRPYVQMTTGIMSAFGVNVETHEREQFFIPAPRHYRGITYNIEPDASAASYFWAAAAIAGGEVTVRGLSHHALQGDVGFCHCLAEMGCEVEYHDQAIRVIGKPLRGIDVNMNSISDTVQTLAAVALFAEGPTTIRDVAHIRHKETDRIGDLARELRRLGAVVDEFSDGMRIEPRTLHAAQIATYNDHRMAMSLALVGLRVPGVVIQHAECTAKTYPRYFEDLKGLTPGPGW